MHVVVGDDDGVPRVQLALGDQPRDDLRRQKMRCHTESGWMRFNRRIIGPVFSRSTARAPPQVQPRLVRAVVEDAYQFRARRTIEM